MLLLPATAMIKMMATIHTKDVTANDIGREEEPTAAEGGGGEANQWNEGIVIPVKSGFGTRSGYGGPLYDAQQHLFRHALRAW